MAKKTRQIYLIGSLRNPEVPEIANEIEQTLPNIKAFDDWHAAGPNADDEWKRYEQARGRTYLEALNGPHVWNVFNFDRKHLDESDMGLLIMPAGKSCHLELGHLEGQGKPIFILLEPDKDDRWDIMYRFAAKVTNDREALYSYIALAFELLGRGHSLDDIIKQLNR